MINALEVSSEVDLAGFSRFLKAQGLPHSITEQGLNQVVWVADETALRYVRVAYAEFQVGRLPGADTEDTGRRRRLAQPLFDAFRGYPVTMAFILLCILLFPVGMMPDEMWTEGLFAQMMFVSLVDGQYTLNQGEVWRLFTPMFIHFSLLHIVFNLLWVWEIGRRVEYAHGAAAMFGIVMLTSLSANLLQYAMSPPGFFGGMSGVVFGLLGHSWAWSRLVPSRSMGVVNGIYIFMLVYLALGFTGAIDLLGLGNLANGAHLGGLAGGLATGTLAALLVRRGRPQPPAPPGKKMT